MSMHMEVVVVYGIIVNICKGDVTTKFLDRTIKLNDYFDVPKDVGNYDEIAGMRLYEPVSTQFGSSTEYVLGTQLAGAYAHQDDQDIQPIRLPTALTPCPCGEVTAATLKLGVVASLYLVRSFN